ncbi:TPA: conjugal transfer protein [Staphylococcus aureus]|nr:conjugal transfer protein [Staphylococcus aureus]HDB3143314.1 conjugal transfer protein [Staphylococcus aureus]HDE8374447.1 conjugal transfer protein [Staphylococcus aureus]
MKILKNGLKTLYYKWQANGKEMKEQKARKKEKSSQMPPQYKYRKAGIITFWSLFGFILLMSLLMFFVIIGGGGKGNQQKVQEKPQNQATMQPAVEFSKEFAQKYLTYKSSESNTDRNERLRPYFVKEMNDGAGIEIDDTKDTESKVESLDLKGIEDAGDNKGYITLRTNLKQTEYIKEEKKKGKKKEEVKTPKDKQVTKYLTVPVIYKDGSYAVYEYPKFTKVNENDVVSYKYRNSDLTVNNNAETDVKKFLNTFFEVYASESKDKVAYMLGKGVHVNTLEGDLKFNKIENLDLYNTKGDTNDLTAIVDVKFNDDIGTIYTTRYHIKLKEQDDKYLITKFGENK